MGLCFSAPSEQKHQQKIHAAFNQFYADTLCSLSIVYEEGCVETNKIKIMRYKVKKVRDQINMFYKMLIYQVANNLAHMDSDEFSRRALIEIFNTFPQNYAQQFIVIANTFGKEMDSYFPDDLFIKGGEKFLGENNFFVDIVLTLAEKKYISEAICNDLLNHLELNRYVLLEEMRERKPLEQSEVMLENQLQEEKRAFDSKGKSERSPSPIRLFDKPKNNMIIHEIDDLNLNEKEDKNYLSKMVNK